LLPRAALALGAFVVGWAVTSSLALTETSPPAPLNAFSDVDATRQIVIADRRGRPAVVNLWATWCPPCRREMPAMADVARARSDVDFIFANQGEGADTIRSFLDEAGIALETVVIDPASRLSRHYRAVGMPTTLFINADGSLSGMHVGEISREVLAERVAELRKNDGKRKP
jgi:thiol-disulfide isomerase/thioredoxin